jgi:hypothetical protein
MKELYEFRTSIKDRILDLEKEICSRSEELTTLKILLSDLDKQITKLQYTNSNIYKIF